MFPELISRSNLSNGIHITTATDIQLTMHLRQAGINSMTSDPLTNHYCLTGRLISIFKYTNS